jgi:uncharacterized membrane protein
LQEGRDAGGSGAPPAKIAAEVLTALNDFLVKTRHLILLLLWGAVALQCLYYFPLLPEAVASHFDGAGRPNGWSSKQGFIALHLSIAGLMTFVFFVLPRLLRRIRPSLINLPNREYWLIPERKEQALAMLDEEMGWFGIAILMMIISTTQLAINANLAGGDNLRSETMWMLLGGFFAFTVVWLIRLYRRFRVPS